jgi:DNA topoisomerase IA
MHAPFLLIGAKLRQSFFSFSSFGAIMRKRIITTSMQALIFIEAHGKIPAWSRIVSALGIDATIIATAGHMCRFPDSLYPLGIRISKGQAIDVARTPRKNIDRKIRQALQNRSIDTEILIATDDDPEGDVIALDVMRVIVDVDPVMIDNCLRIRPGAITRDGVELALKRSRAEGGGIDSLVSRAVAGRTRALTDRWMGAAFSRIARTGCGRVRAGILGSAMCWSKSPDLVRSLPETGEITLQARSNSGGLPFTAHVSMRGSIPPALASVAQRYAKRLIPAHVSQMKSIGAAVAPRFKNIAPFNTGDALAYAARFHNVGPKAAMAGLQSAYMKGRISYPRTDNRTISTGSAAQVVQAARVCGMRDVDMQYAAAHAHMEVSGGVTAHEGIYPTPRMTKEDMDNFRGLVLKPIKVIDPDDEDEVEDLMVTLIARRSFEALREGALEPGVFHAREDSDLTDDERAALEDLEWVRAAGQSVPWSRGQITGMRIWPMSSVVIDGMMIEEIGRPSTWASHAHLVSNSGQLVIPEPGSLPEPSMEGRRILKSLPRGIWSPATCRMIEMSMSDTADGEDIGAEITQRMRSRVDTWFSGISPEVRSALVDMLKSEADSGGKSLSKAEASIKSAEIDPDLENPAEDASAELEMDI